MFERLFNRPITVAQQWAGPLLEERLRYLAHLAEQGVARHRLQVRAYYLLMVAQCLRLAERPGELITPGELKRQARRGSQQPGPRKVIGSQWQSLLRELFVTRHPPFRPMDRRCKFLRAPTSSPGKTCRRPRPRSRTYSAVQRPMPRSCRN